MRRAVLITSLAAVGAAATWLAWRQRPPALVESLRALPEPAKVEYVGPTDAVAVVAQLRDWHHVPRELCELDGIDFEANLPDVERVQQDELAIARFLIANHGLIEIFSEGLSEETMPDLHLRFDVLKDLERLETRGGMDKEAVRIQREFRLEVGIPGRLLLTREIDPVLPLEDAKALKAAGPAGAAKGIQFDAASLEARRKAMVARLPAAGIALVVLGGTHDLGPNVGADVLYVRVTPRSYPGD